MITNNINYFKTSIENKEQVFDSRYLFLNLDKDLETYREYTKKLKELIITIKVLRNKKKIVDDSLYLDLFVLSKNIFSQKSEFNCFVNACDTTLKIIGDNVKQFKQIVHLYIDCRPISEHTPCGWIQALIDKGSSRAKGHIGENKIIDIALNKNFKEVFTWQELHEGINIIAKFNTATFNLKNIKKELNIDLDLKNQGKLLDIIIKNKKQIIFIEAKHLKETGGSQDKQLHELINIIQTPTNKKNILYGAFLDGVLSNRLLNITDKQLLKPATLTKEDKTTKQQKSIVTSLMKNTNNYWFNTAGFQKFITEFKS
ncbi:MAG: hypothetical protein DRQ51_07280 [Gammaproteobacteria bacterium]|nr:MAG: hypothetical protein DRQ51_07280 [Gammaproteobacteria bacterium]